MLRAERDVTDTIFVPTGTPSNKGLCSAFINYNRVNSCENAECYKSMTKAPNLGDPDTSPEEFILELSSKGQAEVTCARKEEKVKPPR